MTKIIVRQIVKKIHVDLYKRQKVRTARMNCKADTDFVLHFLFFVSFYSVYLMRLHGQITF